MARPGIEVSARSATLTGMRSDSQVAQALRRLGLRAVPEQVAALQQHTAGDEPDDRRQAVSELLAGYGPRVQYSVFEVAVPSPHVFEELHRALVGVIDGEEDQVRVYPLRVPDLDKVMVLGERRLEEREDFWIVDREGVYTESGSGVRTPCCVQGICAGQEIDEVKSGLGHGSGKVGGGGRVQNGCIVAGRGP